MEQLILIKFFFIILIGSSLIAENKLSIVQYIEIPNELDNLKFNPDRINWFLRNSFLLLDSYNSELLLLKNSGE